MKLKLTNREIILLTILGVCLVAAAIYYAVIKPQLDNVGQLEAKANEYSAIINDIKTKASLDNPIYKEYQGLNEKTSNLLNKYYPEIIQEKFILLLNDKISRSNVKIESITFQEPALVDLSASKDEKEPEIYELEDLAKQIYSHKLQGSKAENNGETDKTSKDEGLKVEKMTVSIALRGSYSQIYTFLKEIELENKSIICTYLNLNSGEANILSGEAVLDFYSIPKPFKDEGDYYDWNIKGDYGKDNPF